ncbi:MAG: 4-hydroxybenzoate octaprenyltransferase [Candidatus Omnitrophica bacterium]|nr:4-hydroxybenzoate octaprenyltransferase [Candidatus Omnitrophota bacterium]
MIDARLFVELVRFEHTLFALPFAYLGLIAATGGRPQAGTFVWVTLAMVGARTAAMTMNRIFDRGIDARNPRTKDRPLVTGQVSLEQAWIVTAASGGLFLLSAWMLNPLCFRLAFVAVALISGYHFMKRFTWLCHFGLGLALSSAPLGGWIAATGRWDWKAAPLGAAVLLWVAGFDILYSLQDVEFDRKEGLRSVPVRFGERKALVIMRACHIASVASLAIFGLIQGYGWVYWIGMGVCGGLLVLENNIVNENDLRHLQTAFFTINSWFGILLLIFTFLEIFR